MSAKSCAMGSGYPLSCGSRPSGQVVVFMPSGVVGAICPLVMPKTALLMKMMAIFSPRLHA